MIHIVCPNCHFTKDLPEERVPAGAKWATCPRCKQRFEIIREAPSAEEKTSKGTAARPGVPSKRLSPWENRSVLGIRSSIYQTFKAVLFSPRDLFSRMEGKGRFSETLAVGMLFGSIGNIFWIFWQFLMIPEGLMDFDPGQWSHLFIGLVFVGIMILVPIFTIINILTVSGIIHLLLMIVRSGRQGFEATFKVVSYAQATQILAIVPFVGAVAGWFWLAVAQVIGLKEIHGTSYGRVIIALLIPFVLLILIVAAIVIPLIIFS